jgi:hypothetical protein
MNKFRRALLFWQQHPRLRFAVKAGILFGLFFLISWKRLDPDFGWHLRSGNIFRHSGIPAHDIYTYTAPHFPWIDHEWGNDVILSILYGVGGYTLLAVLYGALWAGALLLVGRRARLYVLVIAALAIMPYAGIRPIAWTAFFFALTLTVLERAVGRLVWYLPLLFIIWANLHAGFIVGLAAIAYYAIRRRRWQLAVILGLAVLASFVNAYGIRLYDEIFRTLFDRQLHNQIEEWTAFSIIPACWPFIVLWAIGFVQYDARHWKRWLQLPTLLLASALSASRNFPLFVVAALAPAGQYVEALHRSIPKNLDRGRKAMLAVLVAIVLFAVVYSAHNAFWSFGPRTGGYPVQAIAYLRDHPCPGNLFNDYNYGGFLIWKLPNVPVFIDGRMPSWKAPDGEKYMNTYEHLLHHPATYPATFSRYDIKCVLLGNNSLNSRLIKRLEGIPWRHIPTQDNSVLLVEPGAVSD